MRKLKNTQSFTQVDCLIVAFLSRPVKGKPLRRWLSLPRARKSKNTQCQNLSSENDLILKIRGEYKDFPIIFVGGGSALLPPAFFREEYQIPSYFNVANAYGAALSEISGTVDTIVSLQKREEILIQLYEQAKQKAINQGANAKTLRLVDQQIIPYSYVPNQMARVIVRYCGKKM